MVNFNVIKPVNNLHAQDITSVVNGVQRAATHAESVDNEGTNGPQFQHQYYKRDSELEYEDLIFSLHILCIIEDGLHELLEPEKMFILQKRDNFSFT